MLFCSTNISYQHSEAGDLMQLLLRWKCQSGDDARIQIMIMKARQINGIISLHYGVAVIVPTNYSRF